MNEKSPELVQLLRAARREVRGERMERWSSAFEDWLAERETRFNPRVREDSLRAWREFLAFTGKPPWEAAAEDVEAYVESLAARGLGPWTIARRLTGLSEFYRYCQDKEVDPECGGSYNPAREARRPKLTPYEKSNYLSEKEELRLLEAVRQDPSALGKRDYALILTLLKTGRKAGEVRKLTWGEFKEDSSMPGPVREAVRDALEAAGRLEGIQDEETLFAPSRAPLIREAGNQAEDWDGSRPLSADGLTDLVKLHAGRAGLKAEKINCHTLRHTAAMRSIEAGGSPEAAQTLLGRSSIFETRKYLRRLAKRPKGRLRARRRADDETREGDTMRRPNSRGPCRARPGNRLALVNQLLDMQLPELDALAKQGIELDEFDWMILRWRLIIRQVTKPEKEPDTLKKAIRKLELVGLASTRLAKVLLLREKQRKAESEAESFENELRRAVEKVESEERNDKGASEE